MGIAGMAESIPSTSLIIHGNYYNTSSLPHEMGHCLGLYHTHHGTVEEGGDTNQCAELVDGSNSLTCGDYIPDTAADPNNWSSSSCSYTGTGTDANGDTYDPDPQNLMSYAKKTCRTLFSPDQGERMVDFIENEQALRNTVLLNISGPSLLCSSGASFTINNLPSGATVTWEESANLTEGPAGTFTANGSGEGWVQPTITGDCEDITLPRKTVWVGVPYLEYYGGNIVDFNTKTELYDICEGTNTFCEAVHPSGEAYIDDWDWSVTGGVVYPDGSNNQYADIIPDPGSSFVNVNLRAHNACGWSDWGLEVLNVFYCFGYYMTFSPNPTSIETTMTIESESTEKIVDENEEWDLEVYDQGQKLKLKKQKLKGKSTKINTQNWKEGVYLVRVKYKDEIITGKLIKQ